MNSLLRTRGLSLYTEDKNIVVRALCSLPGFLSLLLSFFLFACFYMYITN